MLLITALLGAARAPGASETTHRHRLVVSATRQDAHVAGRAPSILPSMPPIWTSAIVTRRGGPPDCDAAQLPHQDSPAGDEGPPAAPERSSSMGRLPPSLEGFLWPGEGTLPLGGTGAGLADGPEREGHARHERVPRVCGQGGVGGGVGRHGPVAQRGRVDVRVEAGGQRRVGCLLHGARDHQLEQAANTRTRVRRTAAGLACPLVDAAPPEGRGGLGTAVASHRHSDRHQMQAQNTEVSRGGTSVNLGQMGVACWGGTEQKVTWRWQD